MPGKRDTNVPCKAVTNGLKYQYEGRWQLAKVASERMRLQQKSEAHGEASPSSRTTVFRSSLPFHNRFRHRDCHLFCTNIVRMHTIRDQAAFVHCPLQVYDLHTTERCHRLD